MDAAASLAAPAIAPVPSGLVSVGRAGVSRGSKLLIGGLILAVIVGAALALYFGLRGRFNNDSGLTVTPTLSATTSPILSFAPNLTSSVTPSPSMTYFEGSSSTSSSSSSSSYTTPTMMGTTTWRTSSTAASK